MAGPKYVFMCFPEMGPFQKLSYRLGWGANSSVVLLELGYYAERNAQCMEPEGECMILQPIVENEAGRRKVWGSSP